MKIQKITRVLLAFFVAPAASVSVCEGTNTYVNADRLSPAIHIFS